MSARGAIALVAWREIRERLRSPAFLWSTVIMLVIVGASSALPALLQEETTYRIAVVAPAPRGLDAGIAARRGALRRRRAAAGCRIGGGRARTSSMPKSVDALLLLADDRIVFKTSVDAQLAAAADTAVRALRRHLPPAPELATATLEPAERGHPTTPRRSSPCSALRCCSARSRSTASGCSPVWSRRRATASSS